MIASKRKKKDRKQDKNQQEPDFILINLSQ